MTQSQIEDGKYITPSTYENQNAFVSDPLEPVIFHTIEKFVRACFDHLLIWHNQKIYTLLYFGSFLDYCRCNIGDKLHAMLLGNKEVGKTFLLDLLAEHSIPGICIKVTDQTHAAWMSGGDFSNQIMLFEEAIQPMFNKDDSDPAVNLYKAVMNFQCFIKRTVYHNNGERRRQEWITLFISCLVMAANCSWDQLNEAIRTRIVTIQVADKWYTIDVGMSGLLEAVRVLLSLNSYYAGVTSETPEQIAEEARIIRNRVFNEYKTKELEKNQENVDKINNLSDGFGAIQLSNLAPDDDESEEEPEEVPPVSKELTAIVIERRLRNEDPALLSDIEKRADEEATEASDRFIQRHKNAEKQAPWEKNDWINTPKPRPCVFNPGLHRDDGTIDESVRNHYLKTTLECNKAGDLRELNVRYDRCIQWICNSIEQGIDQGYIKPPTMDLANILIPLFLAKLRTLCPLSVWGPRICSHMMLYTKNFINLDKAHTTFFFDSPSNPYYNEPLMPNYVRDLNYCLTAELHHIVLAFSLLSEQCVNTWVSLVLEFAFNKLGYIDFLANLGHYSGLISFKSAEVNAPEGPSNNKESRNEANKKKREANKVRANGFAPTPADPKGAQLQDDTRFIKSWTSLDGILSEDGMMIPANFCNSPECGKLPFFLTTHNHWLLNKERDLDFKSTVTVYNMNYVVSTAEGTTKLQCIGALAKSWSTELKMSTGNLAGILKFLSEKTIKVNFSFVEDWDPTVSFFVMQRDKLNYLTIPGTWEKKEFPIVKWIPGESYGSKEGRIAFCIWALKSTQTENVIKDVIKEVVSKANLRKTIIPLAMFGENGEVSGMKLGGKVEKKRGLNLVIGKAQTTRNLFLTYYATSSEKEVGAQGYEEDDAINPNLPSLEQLEVSYEKFMDAIGTSIAPSEVKINVDLATYPHYRRMLSGGIARLRLNDVTGLLEYEHVRNIDDNKEWIPVRDLAAPSVSSMVHKQILLKKYTEKASEDRIKKNVNLYDNEEDPYDPL